jgi:hypothetical protein
VVSERCGACSKNEPAGSKGELVMERGLSLENPGFSNPTGPKLDGALGRVPAKAALVGLALSALFGLALGARTGGVDLLRHAVGVPAGLLAVGLLGVPSLFVLLSLFDTPLTLTDIADESARAVGSVGLLLAGLAPAATLLVVTIQSAPVAAGIARLGLLLAGAIGGVPLLLRLFSKLDGARFGLRWKAALTLGGFALFGVALSARTWQALLPILGGGS